MSGITVLLAGLGLVESPRWHDGRFWFADWSAGQIRVVEPDGTSTVAAEIASIPLCFDWLPDGRLVAVSSADGRLLRQETDSSLETHADLSGLAPFPWNDIAVDSRGNAYVGNVGFDFPGGEPAPGTLAHVAPDGTARQMADGLMFANGMLVTPDDATLIVAESYANRLTAFDIGSDGSLSGRRVWAELGDGVPDGICLDARNAVWYADVPNQRCVRVAEGGEVLQTITADLGCFACALGGADEPTLCVTAARWPGIVGDEPSSGQVFTMPVAVPRPGAAPKFGE